MGGGGAFLREATSVPITSHKFVDASEAVATLDIIYGENLEIP